MKIRPSLDILVMFKQFLWVLYVKMYYGKLCNIMKFVTWSVPRLSVQQTVDNLLHQEQSDQGLHCFPRTCCQINF